MDIEGDAPNANITDQWAADRIRGVSTEPIMSRSLRAVPDAAATYNLLSQHLEHVVQESNCALRDKLWISSLKTFAGLRDWPLADEGCVSSSAHQGRKPKYPPDVLYDAMLKINLAIEQVGSKVVEKAMGNFTNALSSHSWRYSRGDFERCTVQKMLGVRYQLPNGRNQWYLLSGITNSPPSTDKSDWDRQFVNEFVGVDADRDFIDSLSQNLRRFKAPHDSNRTKFATSFELWGGRVGLSAIFNMVIEDVPALIQSLDSSSLDANQAIDATTTSNIAILALPMALNVIPVSLLSDISALGIIAYTIISDVLTTVPFIIKGFELLAMSYRRHLFEETWFTGRKHDKWIIAETWASQCRLRRVRRLGISFILVGFAILVIGVLLEIWAHRLRKKWVRNGTFSVGVAEHLKAALLHNDIEMGQSRGESPRTRERRRFHRGSAN